MLKKFCKISDDSDYFDDAKSKLEGWIDKLERPNDIYIPLNTYKNEEKLPCPIAEDILIPEEILDYSPN